MTSVLRSAILASAMALAHCQASAAEFWCEGVDDDANGEIDEGCARTCVEPFVADSVVTIAPSSLAAASLSVARAGTGLGWAYADSRAGASQVWFQVTATSGAPDKPEARLSDGVHAATDPAIAWRTTGGFGASWVDSRDGNQEVYFRSVDANGMPESGTLDSNLSKGNGASLNPAIVWTGTEFGVVWDDVKGNNRDIYFSRVTRDGQPLGQTVRVTTHTALQEIPSVAWDGAQYAVAWTDERDGNREIYARRIDATGNLVGGEVRVTTASGTSDRVVIRALKAAEFGLTWQDARSGANAIWFAQWTGPGYASPVNVSVSSGGPARRPTLASTGAEYLITWIDGRNGSDDLYARRVATNGGLLSPEIRLTTGAAPTGTASVWHGSGAGVGFLANLSGSVRPQLILVSCGGSDADVDGANLAHGDCNDANAQQRPGLSETCDSIDNDCSGTIDEFCRGTCRGGHLSAPIDAFVSPIGGTGTRMVTAGTGYGITWQERELFPGCCEAWSPFFRKLDGNGVPISPAVRIPEPSLSGENPSLCWTGAEYGIAFEQYNRTDFVARIAFQRVAADGSPIGLAREITKDPTPGSAGHRMPVVVWRGGEYGVLFLDVRADGSSRANMFLRLDQEGRPLERPRDVSPSPFSEFGTITPDGPGYALSYLYQIDPFFQRLDRYGGLRGPAYRAKNDALDQGFPQAVVTPSGYAFTWTEDSGPPGIVGDIFLQRLDGNGAPIGGAINLTPEPSTGLRDAYRSALTWIGSEFNLLYFETIGKIWLQRLDATGAAIGARTLIAQDPGDGIGDPAIAWNGVRPILAWVDSRTGGVGHPRPVTAFLTCCEDTAAPAPISGAGWISSTTFSWVGNGSARYDRVRGDLGVLRGSTGNYTPTVLDCKNDLSVTSTSELDPVAPDSGYYFVVRGDDECGPGSYNDPVPSPDWNRDPGIAAATGACP